MIIRTKKNLDDEIKRLFEQIKKDRKGVYETDLIAYYDDEHGNKGYLSIRWDGEQEEIKAVPNGWVEPWGYDTNGWEMENVEELEELVGMLLENQPENELHGGMYLLTREDCREIFDSWESEGDFVVIDLYDETWVSFEEEPIPQDITSATEWENLRELEIWEREKIVEMGEKIL